MAGNQSARWLRRIRAPSVGPPIGGEGALLAGSNLYRRSHLRYAFASEAAPPVQPGDLVASEGRGIVAHPSNHITLTMLDSWASNFGRAGRPACDHAGRPFVSRHVAACVGSRTNRSRTISAATHRKPLPPSGRARVPCRGRGRQRAPVGRRRPTPPFTSRTCRPSPPCRPSSALRRLATRS
jgi:hypothetical protein